MNGPGRRFDPSELRGGDPGPTSAELAEALSAARSLEAHASGDVVRPSSGFEDRVMAAIATEPAPRVVVRSGSATRGGRPAAFLLAVRDAWAIATSGGRPTAVRAQAFGLVLLVVVAAGSLTGVAAVGVGSFLSLQANPSPSIAEPTLSPSPVAPSASPSFSPSASPAESPSASPSPTLDASPTPSSSPSPAGTARPTSSPLATERPSATRTPESTRTPMPTETNRPTGTPDSTETPDSSDDHGGGSPGPG